MIKGLNNTIFHHQLENITRRYSNFSANFSPNIARSRYSRDIPFSKLSPAYYFYRIRNASIYHIDAYKMHSSNLSSLSNPYYTFFSNCFPRYRCRRIIHYIWNLILDRRSNLRVFTRRENPETLDIIPGEISVIHDWFFSFSPRTPCIKLRVLESGQLLVSTWIWITNYPDREYVIENR